MPERSPPRPTLRGLSERDASRPARRVMDRVVWDGKLPLEALPARTFLARLR